METAENKEVKASVDTVDYALIEYTEKDRQKDVDLYLDTAVQADKFGCGSRLICELHRRAESELKPEEVLLRSMFKYEMTLLDGIAADPRPTIKIRQHMRLDHLGTFWLR